MCNLQVTVAAGSGGAVHTAFKTPWMQAAALRSRIFGRTVGHQMSSLPNGSFFQVPAVPIKASTAGTTVSSSVSHRLRAICTLAPSVDRCESRCIVGARCLKPPKGWKPGGAALRPRNGALQATSKEAASPERPWKLSSFSAARGTLLEMDSASAPDGVLMVGRLAVCEAESTNKAAKALFNPPG